MSSLVLTKCFILKNRWLKFLFKHYNCKDQGNLRLSSDQKTNFAFLINLEVALNKKLMKMVI